MASDVQHPVVLGRSFNVVVVREAGRWVTRVVDGGKQ